MPGKWNETELWLETKKKNREKVIKAKKQKYQSKDGLFELIL